MGIIFVFMRLLHLRLCVGVVTYLAIIFHRPGFVWCPRGWPAGSHRAQCVPDAGNSWGAPVWCLWSRGSCPAPRPADDPDHTHCCSGVWFHRLLSTRSETGSRKHIHTPNWASYKEWASENKWTCFIIPLQKAINNKHGNNTPTHSLSNTHQRLQPRAVDWELNQSVISHLNGTYRHRTLILVCWLIRIYCCKETDTAQQQ